MGARAQEAVTFCSKQTDINLLRLLGILATGANDETGIIDPAPNRETLARLSNCTERTITNRIDKLVESGELEQIRMGSGPGNPSAYRILIKISDSTMLKNETPLTENTKGEKGENLAYKVEQLSQEVAELKALFFTLLAQKGETEDAKGERVKDKGGKGESARVKGLNELDADDPFDPKDNISPPTPPKGEYSEVESAVCNATKKQPLLLSEVEQKQIDGLFKSGYTAEEVEKLYSPGGWWFVQYWKGKKGQRPKIADIVDTIGDAVESITAKKNGHVPKRVTILDEQGEPLREVMV